VIEELIKLAKDIRAARLRKIFWGKRADRAISLVERRNLYAQARDVADEVDYPATIRGRNPVKAGGFGTAAGGCAIHSRQARSVRN
jgi:hypothetical protein